MAGNNFAEGEVMAGNNFTKGEVMAGLLINHFLFV